jgi:hypothetical protein
MNKFSYAKQSLIQRSIGSPPVLNKEMMAGLDVPIQITGKKHQRLMTQAYIHRKRNVASSLEPVKRYKKTDGSIGGNFNLNMIKSKYHGIENFLDESYARKTAGGPRAIIGSTTRSSIKRSWLNQSVNVHSESGGNTTRFMNEMINKSIDITMFEKDGTTNANTSRDKGFITGSA